jgi:acyl-CoA synthetase (AMP-forming)/AMP-acid ligase II
MATEFPDKDFIVMPHARLSFGEVERASRSFGKRLLAAGLGKGTRLGLYDTFSIEWVIAWLAGARLGCLVMPFSSVYCSYQHEVSAVAAHTAMGYPNVLWGSDYPHLEGTFGHTQKTLHELFDDHAPEVTRRITRGSFEELFPHVSVPPASRADGQRISW